MVIRCFARGAAWLGALACAPACGGAVDAASTGSSSEASSSSQSESSTSTSAPPTSGTSVGESSSTTNSTDADTSSSTSDSGGSSTSGDVGSPTSCGDGVFDPRMPYCFAPPVVLDPTPAYDVATVDATGDGIIDVIAATEDGLAIFPGLGDGDLGAVELLPTPSTPVRLLVADLDAGDGSFADVTVACPDANAVVVFRSVSGEALVAMPPIPTGDEPVDVWWYPSWESGLYGFVVAEAGAGTVSNYVDAGAGSFELEQTFDVGGRPIALATGSDWIAAADADADLLTMIWMYEDAPVQSTSHAMAADPVRLFWGFLGHAQPRLLVLAEGADLLTTYFPGDGELTEEESVSYPGGPRDVAFTLAGQTWGSMLVAHRIDGTVSLSPQAPGEGFYLDPPVTTIDVGPEPVAVHPFHRADDVDDIVVASPISGVVLVRADP